MAAYKIVPMLRGRIPLELRFFVMAPFFHAGGWGAGPLCVWLPLGITPILFSEKPRFDAREALHIINKYKPAVLGGVPTMFEKMFAIPDIGRYDFVAMIGAGSAKVTKELKKKIFEVFPNSIYMEVFGQTELTPWAATRVESAAQIDKIKDTIGSPFSTFEVRIVNEDGQDVNPGEVGELIYRGEGVLKGYYKDPERNAQVLKDGWYYSGDLGYFDEDGEIRIYGRKMKMINVGGEKVYPPEVEEILESHPKVEHALLIGMADDVYGEIPVALIQPKKGEMITEEEIIDFCKNKMSGYKRPKFCVFVEEVPLTEADKVRRKEAEDKFRFKVEEHYKRWKKS